MKIQCGCDPEVVIIKDNKYVPCVGIVPGTKEEPFAVKGSRIGLKIQEDGVSLEFNIDPVSREDFWDHIVVAKEELAQQVEKYLGRGAQYAVVDGAEFTDEDLKSPQASTFGCDPDFLAHDRGAMRPRIDPKKMGNVRAFAGHIHVGYDKAKVDPLIPDWAIVAFMEAFTYARYVTEGYDQQPHRRKFYGLAGLYRPKEYGFEYRTPSNFWLNSRNHVNAMFKAAEVVLSRPTEARMLYDQIDWKAVQEMVNKPSDRNTKLYQSLSAMYTELANKKEEL